MYNILCLFNIDARVMHIDVNMELVWIKMPNVMEKTIVSMALTKTYLNVDKIL